MTPGDQTVSWSAADKIPSVWFASDTQDLFAFQNIDNLDTGDHSDQGGGRDTLYDAHTGPVDPFDRDPDLGPAPASVPRR